MENRDKEALRYFIKMENVESLCIKGTTKVVTVSGTDNYTDSSFSMNGPLDGDSCEEWCVRCNSDATPRTQYEICICVHAEIRALTQNLDMGTSVFVDRLPCTACALALLDDDRISEVVVFTKEPLEQPLTPIANTLDHLWSTEAGEKVRMRIV